MAGLLSIVADTREQAPYAFDPNRFAVERRTLPAGDYSLVGSEERVAENTVQAQAMKRLREEALRTATLDGIEFPDDSSREEYIEQFLANC